MRSAQYNRNQAIKMKSRYTKAPDIYSIPVNYQRYEDVLYAWMICDYGDVF